jgi:hypothetical protein
MNYAGNRQKSSKIIELEMYIQLDKEKPWICNKIGLSLATVRPTTVLMIKCSFRVVKEIRA